jgi:hypothetical protein
MRTILTAIVVIASMQLARAQGSIDIKKYNVILGTQLNGSINPDAYVDVFVRLNKNDNPIFVMTQFGTLLNTDDEKLKMASTIAASQVEKQNAYGYRVRVDVNYCKDKHYYYGLQLQHKLVGINTIYWANESTFNQLSEYNSTRRKTSLALNLGRHSKLENRIYFDMSMAAGLAIRQRERDISPGNTFADFSAIGTFATTTNNEELMLHVGCYFKLGYRIL